METYDPAKIERQILQTAIDDYVLMLLEADLPYDELVMRNLMPPIMRVAIAAARRHFKANPDQLLAVPHAQCAECGGRVQDTRVEGHVFHDDFDPAPVVFAGPCGHRQP